jgi:hypothetical protein
MTSAWEVPYSGAPRKGGGPGSKITVLVLDWGVEDGQSPRWLDYDLGAAQCDVAGAGAYPRSTTSTLTARRRIRIQANHFCGPRH